MVVQVYGRQWYETFRSVISQYKYTYPLREFALQGRLREWTGALTKAVAETCRRFGWVVVAKGEEDEALPIKRKEYLGIDIVAFEGQSFKWRLPIAVFELENKIEKDLVAYSLWKVSVVCSSLRGVFCYQENPEEIGNFAKVLKEDLTILMLESDKVPLLLIVGTRGKAETFPDGFFQPWYWDYDWRAFRKLT